MTLRDQLRELITMPQSTEVDLSRYAYSNDDSYIRVIAKSLGLLVSTRLHLGKMLVRIRT